MFYGNNGKATHLSAEEQSQVTRHARKVVGQDYIAVIIAGCSANSVPEISLLSPETICVSRRNEEKIPFIDQGGINVVVP